MDLGQKEKAALLAADRAFLWHPFTQMQDYLQGEEPLLITHAKGSWIYSGKEAYLDAVSSMWTGTHGHNHPRLNKALVTQLGKMAHTTLLGASHPPAIRLAEKLVSIAPKGLNHVFFSDNGSTAMEVAIKMAYEVKARSLAKRKNKTQAPKLFITFEGAYHGDTLGAISIGGVDLFHSAYGPLLFQTVKLPYPSETGEGKSLAHHLKLLKRILNKYKNQLVGAVMEPGLQAAGGMSFMIPGYLKALQEELKTNDLLLILDEIATGFYRLGPRFAAEAEGVSPDLMAVGKGLTGGYLPLAATLTSREIYEAYLGEYKEAKHFFHGHTFTGNPLAAAVSLENLKLFESAEFLLKKQKRETSFSECLTGISDHPLVHNVRHRGMAGAFDLVKCKSPLQPFCWEDRIGHKFALILRKHGVFMRPLGSTVVLMPPLSLKPSESKFLLGALSSSLDDLGHQLEKQ